MRIFRADNRAIASTCIATIAAIGLSIVPPQAGAEEALDLYAKTANTAPGFIAEKIALAADAKPGDENSDKYRVKLSTDSKDLITRLNLQPLFDRYKMLSTQLSKYKGQPPSLEKLALHQEVGDARHDLAQIILKMNLEVDYVLAVIDGEQNKFSEILNEMIAKRDKNVWLSTVLSQWSNGMLWSASSSFTIASTNHPKYSIADGAIGICAGVIPTALALRSLRQMNGEKRELLGFPNMLAPIFDRGTDDECFYPVSVWNWLNQIPAKGNETKTRRQTLIDRWTKANYLYDPRKPKSEEHLAALTGTLGYKREMTIALLQNRQNMLVDLRTEVMQLKRALLELINAVE